MFWPPSQCGLTGTQTVPAGLRPSVAALYTTNITHSPNKILMFDDRQTAEFSVSVFNQKTSFGFLCFLPLSGSDHVLTFSHPSGLDSDESYEGVSESSFKDALVFDSSSSQKKNGSVPQENGVRKHRYSCIPVLWMFVAVQKLFELVCGFVLRPHEHFFYVSCHFYVQIIRSHPGYQNKIKFLS